MSEETEICDCCLEEVPISNYNQINCLCYDCMNAEMDQEDEWDRFCYTCRGTGISASGPVEHNCSACGGTGALPVEDDQDEPDDFDPYVDDDYMADKAAAEWENNRFGGY
jgi:RecJ-like exonuclease